MAWQRTGNCIAQTNNRQVLRIVSAAVYHLSLHPIFGGFFLLLLLSFDRLPHFRFRYPAFRYPIARFPLLAASWPRFSSRLHLVSISETLSSSTRRCQSRAAAAVSPSLHIPQVPGLATSVVAAAHHVRFEEPAAS